MHPRDSFQVAILNNCKSVIFAHNHPSDVVKLLQKEIGSCTREHFVMIGLNTKNEVTTLYTVHIGTLDM
ncbi:TPA: JAB domain-containing protein [Staphylococcus aureus]